MGQLVIGTSLKKRDSKEQRQGQHHCSIRLLLLQIEGNETRLLLAVLAVPLLLEDKELLDESQLIIVEATQWEKYRHFSPDSYKCLKPEQVRLNSLNTVQR